MTYLKLAEPALLVAAATVLAFPEARLVPMRLLVALLWLIVTLPPMWVSYQDGTLRMTPRQLYKTANARPRTSLLSLLATVLGTIAVVVIT